MTVLCVVAHPDDECFLGASIARFASEGHQVSVLAMADGETSRSFGYDPHGVLACQAIERRMHQHDEAMKVLGCHVVTSAEVWTRERFPDQRLDTVALLDLTRVIEAAIAHVKPRVVYTHSPHDLNADHWRVYEAVLPAVRPKSGVKEVYSFAGPRMMSFHPTSFVEVTAAHLKRQRDALQCYGGELAGELELLLARQVEFGYVAGVPWAEGFETVRVLR